MGEWTADSKSHVAHMKSNDLCSNEKSKTITKETTGDAKIELIHQDGSNKIIKEKAYTT